MKVNIIFESLSSAKISILLPVFAGAYEEILSFLSPTLCSLVSAGIYCAVYFYWPDCSVPSCAG